jgi:hypothetical protein
MSDFEDLVEQYERYLARVEPASTSQARPRITAWLQNGIPVLRVRIALPDSPAGEMQPLPTTR